MKKRIIFIFFTFIISTSILPRTDRNFDKMISYYLLDDIKLAKVEFKKFFNKYSDAQLRRSFSFLFNKEREDANDAFFNYLQMKPRSIEGLIGFALSDIGKVSSTIENLKKASRLDPSSSIAFLCIGHEYLKQLNYIQSETYFNLATRKSSPVEFRIVQAFLYLKKKNPDKIIELIKDDFENNQTNFYVNYLLASAYFLKENLYSMVKHMDLLNGEGENKNRGNLLIAKYYIKKRDFNKAKSILFQIKFKESNEEFDTALAITMMNLNSSKSLFYLYKVFKQNMWNKEINKQLGIYFYKRDKKKLVQNFIYRSLLSGIPSEKLKEYFSGIKFDIPDYKIQNFFQLFSIKWINNNLISVFGKKNSGDRTSVYIIDTDKNKILRRLDIPKTERGVFYKAYCSNKGNIIFSFFNPGNNHMSIYALFKKKKTFNFKKIIEIKSYMHENLVDPSILVGFDKDGAVAYITDGGIKNVAFQSPFLVKWSLTNVNPVYPKYPFDIIKYDFNSGEAFKILNSNQMKLVPIRAVQKYFLINQAYIGNATIKSMITNGQKMDIISAEKVKTFFEENLNSFLIYIKGSQDSFNAILYKNDNSTKSLSETMFLGEKILNETTDIELFRLDSEKKNIFIMRKDTNQLLKFNYDTYLYYYLNKNISQLYYSKFEDVFYSIEDKGDISGLKNKSTVVFSIDPYSKLKKFGRTDIQRIDGYDDLGNMVFVTRNGEKLIIDEYDKFKYISPSFEGALYSRTIDKRKEAVFINGRLMIMEKNKKIKKDTKKKKNG